MEASIQAQIEAAMIERQDVLDGVAFAAANLPNRTLRGVLSDEQLTMEVRDAGYVETVVASLDCLRSQFSPSDLAAIRNSDITTADARRYKVRAVTLDEIAVRLVLRRAT